MGVAETVEGFGKLRPGNSIWNHKWITILRMGGGGVQNEGYVSKVRMENKGGRVGEGGKDGEGRREEKGENRRREEK